MMQFSDDTLSILKNFSEINPSIMFKPGNTIRTISPQKTVMAAASCSEEFDAPAVVYDLSRFLGTLSLFDAPDIAFKENRFEIASKSTHLDYYYAAENTIITPPDRDIELSEVNATVQVSWSELQKVIAAARLLQLSEIQFEYNGNNVVISAINSKTQNSDTYKTVVNADEVSSEPFKILIKVENLKLIPNRDYTISMSNKGITHFKSDTVQYWIACEAV